MITKEDMDRAQEKYDAQVPEEEKDDFSDDEYDYDNYDLWED